MKECALPYGITTLACAIADSISDNTTLEILAASLTQLADTLVVIALSRASTGARKGDKGC